MNPTPPLSAAIVTASVFGPWSGDEPEGPKGGYDVQIKTPAGLVIVEMGADFLPIDFSYTVRGESVVHWKPASPPAAGDGWIPTSAQMPELYVTVLGVMEVQGEPRVRALALEECKIHGRVWAGMCNVAYPEIERVTHWMPLPNPPTVTRGDGT